MKDQYRELADGEITYILQPGSEKRHESPQFQIAGFQFVGQEVVFSLDSDLKAYKGVPTVDAEKYVREQLLGEMDRQLEAYAGNHPDVLAGIWQEYPGQLTTLLNTAGREPRFRPEFQLSWHKLDEGVASIDLQQTTIQFDLRAQCFRMENGSPLARPLYELMEPVGYWRQIAARQREDGIQNAGYAELAKINGFLDGCASVRVQLWDGRRFTLKSNSSITAASLFSPDYKTRKLELNDNYCFTPRPGGHIPVEEIQCLMYGRKVLEVDTAVIRELFGELPAQTMAQDDPELGQSM